MQYRDKLEHSNLLSAREVQPADHLSSATPFTFMGFKPSLLYHHTCHVSMHQAKNRKVYGISDRLNKNKTRI